MDLQSAGTINKFFKGLKMENFDFSSNFGFKLLKKKFISKPFKIYPYDQHKKHHCRNGHYGF